jgi:hypothetical protein
MRQRRTPPTKRPNERDTPAARPFAKTTAGQLRPELPVEYQKGIEKRIVGCLNPAAHGCGKAAAYSRASEYRNPRNRNFR